MDQIGTFGQLQVGGGVEYYTPNGRALTHEERLQLAKRRGVCMHCGVRTHVKKNVVIRKAITDDRVWQGHCIRCEPEAIPNEILDKWRAQYQTPMQKGQTSSNPRLPVAPSMGNERGSSSGSIKRPSMSRDGSHNSNGSKGKLKSSAEPEGSFRLPMGDHTRLEDLTEGSLDASLSLLQVSQPMSKQAHSLHQSAPLLSHMPLANSAASRSQGILDRKLLYQTSMDRNSDRSLGADLPPATSSTSPKPPSTPKSRSGNNSSMASLPDESYNQEKNQNRSVSLNALVKTVRALEPRKTGSLSNPMNKDETYKGGLRLSAMQDESGNFSLVLENEDEFVQSLDSADAIVQAMREYRNDVDRMRAVLRRIRQMSFPDGVTPVIDALVVLMESMKSNKGLGSVSGSEKLIKGIYGALWRISAENSAAKRDIVNAGACTLLIDALRRKDTSGDPVLSLWALGALSSLALYPAAKVAIAQAGGIEVILETMDKHMQDASVFMWACRCLHTLLTANCASDTGDTTSTSSTSEQESADDTNLDVVAEAERNAATVEEGGGVPIIVRSMQPHVLEPLAQLWGTQLFWCLLSRSDEPSVNRVRQQMIENDFATVAIKVLRARSTDSVLFSYTSELLTRILWESDNHKLYEDISECIPSVVRLVNEKEDDELIQEYGCRLLIALCNGGVSTKQALKESDAVNAIISALQIIPDEKGLVQSGIWAICMLAKDSNVMDSALARSSFSSLSKMLNRIPKSQDVLLLACAFLRLASEILKDANLLTSSEIITEMFDDSLDNTGVLDQVVDTILEFCHNCPKDSLSIFQWLGPSRLEKLCRKSTGLSRWKTFHICGSIAAQSSVARESILQIGILDLICMMFKEESLEADYQVMLLELISLVVSSEPLQMMDISSDLINRIIELLKSPRTGETVALSSCRALRNLTIVSKTTSGVNNRAGWVNGIIGKLSVSVEMTVEICKFLAVFAVKYPDECSHVAESIFRCLLDVMHRNGSESCEYYKDIHEWAAKAEAGMTRLLRSSPVTIDNDDVDSVVASVYKVIENDDVSVNALADLIQILADFCYMDEQTMLYAGIIVVLIDIMVERGANELIQERGCAVLAKLSSSENLQVNLSIVQTEGVDVIVSAMTGFRENIKLQTECCRAFAHLSADEESRVLIVANNGLQLIAKGFKQFTKDEAFLDNAAKAVRRLLSATSDATNETLQAVVLETDMIRLLLDCMSSHPAMDSLQENCAEALASIALYGPTSRRRIAEADGIDILVSSIRQQMGNGPILRAILSALSNVLVNGENSTFLQNNDEVMEVVILAMLANMDREEVQRTSCICVNYLSMTQQGLVLKAGGKDAIGHALQAHYNSAKVQIEAFRALSMLTDCDPSATPGRLAITEPEVRAIGGAMNRFMGSEVLQEHGCLILRNVLYWPNNIRIVKQCERDLRDALEKAAERFPHKCRSNVNEILSVIRSI